MVCVNRLLRCAFITYRIAGYSGVATYCRNECKPNGAYDHLAAQDCELPLGDVEVDNEGRALVTEFRIEKVEPDMPSTSHASCEEMNKNLKLVVINVYCPRNDPDNRERFEFKMRFHRLLKARADQYRLEGFHVLIVGDLNVAHKMVDHCEASTIADFDKQPDRVWMSGLLENGYVDCFRRFHPKERHAYTVWNTQTGARATNYGTRIDYVIADTDLLDLDFLLDCRHLSSVMGSDHCPVIAEISPPTGARATNYGTRIDYVIADTDLLDLDFLLDCRHLSSVMGGKKRTTEKGSLFFQETSSLMSRRIENGVSEVVELKTSRVTVSDVDSEWQKTVVREERASEKNVFEKMMLKKKIPKCTGHGELAVERTVKKPGPNFNKRFYACGRPKGFATDKNARCNFFEWA
ncbi:DNA-(apurinic or apyrimidinic site) lyase 2 [Toxocara canis]|uniref:DNA-(apurinic or apyrimidinic site) endonuclease n=1 Tax=Toxocara canis TaxID=6265 RepID=A0A0B2VRP4_TOXCA|nr:DNA-(apurinic or apyrimidinic site) lyase 2 [Toxocara canis]